MITSTSNDKIKNVILLTKKPKARYEQKLFVVDGERALSEIPFESILQLYYCNDRLLDRGRNVLDGFEDYIANNPDMIIDGKPYPRLCEEVSENVMSSMSDTKSPQGILALVGMPDFSLEDMLNSRKEQEPFIMLLENLQDPGNLGTIFRTAEGAGVCGIIMSKDTTDVYSPKVVRATMGNILRMPHIYTDNFHDTIEVLKSKGIRLFAAHLDDSSDYYQNDFTTPVGFLIGNEGNGLKRETADLVDAYIKIPMEGQLESLNAAVASAVLMYECKRQRSTNKS